VRHQQQVHGQLDALEQARRTARFLDDDAEAWVRTAYEVLLQLHVIGWSAAADPAQVPAGVSAEAERIPECRDRWRIEAEGWRSLLRPNHVSTGYLDLLMLRARRRRALAERRRLLPELASEALARRDEWEKMAGDEVDCAGVHRDYYRNTHRHPQGHEAFCLARMFDHLAWRCNPKVDVAPLANASRLLEKTGDEHLLGLAYLDLADTGLRAKKPRLDACRDAASLAYGIFLGLHRKAYRSSFLYGQYADRAALLCVAAEGFPWLERHGKDMDFRWPDETRWSAFVDLAPRRVRSILQSERGRDLGRLLSERRPRLIDELRREVRPKR
jgi:hypothetical protein